MLDGFHCFNTLPTITTQLAEHCERLETKGTDHLDKKNFTGATVHSIGQLVSEWMQDSGPLLAVTSLAEEAHYKALEEVHKLRSKGLTQRKDRPEKGKMSDAAIEQLAESDLKQFEEHLREKDRWEAKEVWQSTSWLDTRRDAEQGAAPARNPLSKVLLQPLEDLQIRAQSELGDAEWKEYSSVYHAASSLFFLRSLTHRQTAALMNQIKMVDDLAKRVTSATTALAGGSRGQEAGTGKFAFELKFGTMSHFNQGLEKLIGAPQANIYREMSYEHGFKPEALQMFKKESNPPKESCYNASSLASNPGRYCETRPKATDDSKAVEVDTHYANHIFKTSNYGSFPTSAKFEWLWMVGEKEQAQAVKALRLT